ncbi:sulfatase-like hydrolase/transferase [Opitutia bacterium ISCC 51]|nr:sulfatase-like hydrolase/transferase [Opitutae bacterium ISCC 51]QXD29916.1 sulfatase-like hydrolase/transferase [Opitutae bacterium ISCC 52]
MKKTRDAGQWTTAIQHYLASISFADAQVGRVLDALNESPHANNTIIVLWSDHGWHLGEKQHWHKRTLWEEGTRIPMIVAAPQVGDAGQVCKQPASTVDLFPTLIELCNLNTPDQTLDGLSLVPCLKNPNKRRAQAAITVDEFKHKSARDQKVVLDRRASRNLDLRKSSEERSDDYQGNAATSTSAALNNRPGTQCSRACEKA